MLKSVRVRPVFTALSPRYQTLPRRILASLIDSVVLLPLFLPELTPIGMLESLLPWPVFDIFAGVAILYYFIRLHARNGQTLGKKLAGVRVLSAIDEQPIGWGAAIRRERPGIWYFTLILSHNAAWIMFNEREGAASFLAIVSEVLVVVQYVWIFADTFSPLFNERRRSLHDYIGGTVVVRTS